MNGDAQLAVFTDISIPEIVREAGYSMTELEPVCTLDQTYFHIDISRDTPQEVVRAWQSTLDDIKRDGTFEKIYRGYLPRSSQGGEGLHSWIGGWRGPRSAYRWPSGWKQVSPPLAWGEVV